MLNLIFKILEFIASPASSHVKIRKSKNAISCNSRYETDIITFINNTNKVRTQLWRKYCRTSWSKEVMWRNWRSALNVSQIMLTTPHFAFILCVTITPCHWGNFTQQSERHNNCIILARWVALQKSPEWACCAWILNTCVLGRCVEWRSLQKKVAKYLT